MLEHTDAELAGLDDAGLLRAAIADARTRPASYAFELSQIWGGLVRGRPDLEEVFVSETAPKNVRAEFRLTGEGVHEHSAEASVIAAFIGGLAKASAAQSEYIARRRRESSKGAGSVSAEHVARPLLATGLGQGSIRFALETTPDERCASDNGLELSPDPETLDDQAFRMVLDVVASDGQDNEMLGTLNDSARRALLPAAESIGKASIDIDITVTQRSRPTQRRQVRTAGVRMLTEVLRQPSVTCEDFRFVGEIDGFKASESKVFLRADGETRAYIVDEVTLRRIRVLAEDEAALFECSGVIERTETPGKKTETKRHLSFIDSARGRGEQGALIDRP